MTNSTNGRCGDCIRCLTDGPCLNEPLEAHSRAHDRLAARCGCTLGTVHKCGSFTDDYRDRMLEPAPATAQERFDALYISSLAIAERLDVSRPAVLHARRRGILPDPVCVNDGQIYIWERATVEPYLKAWENSVKLRRGEQVVFPLGNHAFVTPESAA